MTCLYVYAYFSPGIDIKTSNSFYIYDNNKELVYRGSGNSEWVDLEDVSEYFLDAIISTEDKYFYKHMGFDYLRIAKSLYLNVKNGYISQGGSTISQQYVKNMYLTFDKTWERKLNEAWLTVRLESHYSKEDILEGYLNTINYGHGMYGIENASQYYFGKSAKDLDLAEATMLTGIPKSPSNYSPFINYELSKERQLSILNLLVKNNIITEDEKDSAYQQQLQFSSNSTEDELQNIMYYQDAVLKELKEIQSIPSTYTETHGLKIYTNLDVGAQKNLEKTIADTIPDDSSIETAAVMMNPNTGGIIALVGGRNYNKSSYNRATDSMRQVGSTMKPFLYYAALENGFTSSSAFTSEATTFTFSDKNTYSPKNYNDTYGNKPISMATAIAYSENIYAVKTNLFLGTEALINVARRVGITAELENVPSLPLGTKEINIMEMAAGYSAFANEGYKVTPHLIERVEDDEGNVLYQRDDSKTLVLNSSLVFILNNMLTGTYDSSYIDYNYPTAIGIADKLTHTYGLKSGTTNTDNWNIGYNKNICTAVWVGYDDNTPLSTKEYKYSQNIWMNSVEYYEQGKDDEWYETPDNVSAVLVDPISGKAVSETATKKKLMYFIKGTEPTDTNQVFDEKLQTNTAT